jgi:hypothetical protein
MKNNPEEMRRNRSQSAAIGWPAAIMWICIVSILAGSAIYLFKSCVEAPAKIAGGVADRVSRAARDFISAFMQGTVSIEFKEYCAEVQTNLTLQVATLKQTEQFIRTDEATIGDFPLPDVIISVTAPVDYTYFVDLDKKWEFKLQEKELTVIVPDPLFNRPSFDVSRMDWEVKKDSIFRRTRQIQEEFKKSLMPLAIRRGRAHLAVVRETARAQVAVFVERWLKERFTDGKQYQIKVCFQSECPAALK